MLRLTRTAIGLLTAQYRSVLRKCWAINVGIFGLMGKAVADTIQGTLSAFGVNVTDVLSMMRSLDGMLGIQRHPDVEQRGTEGSSDAFGITSFLQNDWILRPWLRMTRKGATLPTALVAATVALTALPTEAMATVTDDMVPGVNAGIFDKMRMYIAKFGSFGQQYSLLTSKTANSRAVVIDGTTYYYTPKEENADMEEALRYLMALTTYRTTGSNSGYDYKIGSDYYKFDNTSIPTYTDAYKVVETHMGDTGAWAEKQSDGTVKYYKAVSLWESNARVGGGSGINITQGYFAGLNTDNIGGAVYLDNDTGTIIATFINNGKDGKNGGAIYNSRGKTLTTLIGDFISNKGSKGGAIHNYGGTITSLTGRFIGNNASSDGGAIHNNGGTITLLTGDFTGNSSVTNGGAIYNGGAIETLIADFISNKGSKGGAIYNSSGKTLTTLIGDFTDNYATIGGGAIYIDNKSSITTLTGKFIRNISSQGGAIHLNATSSTNKSFITSIEGDFIDNYADNFGGAIYIKKYSEIGNLTGNFTNNETDGHGGAIYNEGGAITSLRGDFSDNVAGNKAGAVYNSGTITSLTGDFIDNRARLTGGAIYNSGVINLLAKDRNITFYGNTDSSGYNDIDTGSISSDKYVSLAVGSNYQISFGGTISSGSTPSSTPGSAAKNVFKIGTDTTSGHYGGQYIFNNMIKNQDIFLGSGNKGANVKFGSIVQKDGSTTYGYLNNSNLTVDGTGSKIDMANEHIDDNRAYYVTLNQDLGLYIDASLASSNRVADTLKTGSTSKWTGDYMLNIMGVNLLTSSRDNKVSVNITDAGNEKVKVDSKIMENITGATNYHTQVTYVPGTGNLVFHDKLISMSDLATQINKLSSGMLTYDSSTGEVTASKTLGAAAFNAVDTTVTASSGNLITSGAVSTALNNYYEKL